MPAGEQVELRYDPANRYDPHAITVVSERGIEIGRLKREDAVLLAPHIGAKRPHRAKLHCLRGGVPGYPRYGARISIAWDERPDYPHRCLDPAQLLYRRNKPRMSWAPARPQFEHRASENGLELVKQGSMTDLAFMFAILLLGAWLIYLMVSSTDASWCLAFA